MYEYFLCAMQRNFHVSLTACDSWNVLFKIRFTQLFPKVMHMKLIYIKMDKFTEEEGNTFKTWYRWRYIILNQNYYSSICMAFIMYFKISSASYWIIKTTDSNSRFRDLLIRSWHRHFFNWTIQKQGFFLWVLLI